MAMQDLIPWGNRGREVARRNEDNPFFTLHREMNRLFDDVFRGFDVTPFGSDRAMGWPHIEVSETDKDIKIAAELPGLDEKDVEVELANGVLAIRGEKKTETEDKERRFSERYYGHFERRIPVEDVEQLRKALDDAPVDHDVVRYSDAGHGFNRDVSPDAYRPGAAADAWRRMLAWFDQHLQ